MCVCIYIYIRTYIITYIYMHVRIGGSDEEGGQDICFQQQVPAFGSESEARKNHRIG